MSGLSKSEGTRHGSPALAGTSSGMESMHESPGPPTLQSARVTAKLTKTTSAKPRRTSETSMTATAEIMRTPEHPKKPSEPPTSLTSEQSTNPPINPAKSPPDKNNRDNTMRSKEGDISQRINQPNQRSRVCGFCWWCCCSCSSKDRLRLTVQSNEENNPQMRERKSLEIFWGDNEPPPTIEDIRTWGESFDLLMRCNAGRKLFREFLKCEYSEENILFWLACEDLKRECNPEHIEEKARLIYEDYISILSPKEVSLDSRVRDVINRNMVQPSPHTFDEAQLQIYTLMHRDSYPRFVNSPMYKTLAQLNTSSRMESSA